MRKKRVLFVGETPFGATANSHMLRSVLSQVDVSKWDVSCFGIGDSVVEDIFHPLPFYVIPAREGNDIFGRANYKSYKKKRLILL